MTALPLFDQIFQQGETRRPIRVESISVSPARKTDPETSKQAASIPLEIRGEQRIRVYEYLVSCGVRGATDYEVGESLGILRTSAGKRRKELAQLGYVVDSGTRRQTDTTASAIVWRIK